MAQTTTAPHQPGAVIGTPGGSLAGAGTSFAKNAAAAKAGQAGEKRTARLLDALARRPGGPTVLHDLRLPIVGVKANIDHVVVAGRRVIILDSKVWKAGFYWTLGVTFRGLERFRPADKKTMVMARQALRDHLVGTGAQVPAPRLVIWPSSKSKPLTTWAAHVPGARTVSGEWLRRTTKGNGWLAPADPRIVERLSQLVIRSGAGAFA